MDRIYGIKMIRTDNIRLRRLDALFAEKVLGKTVAEQAVTGPLGETMRYLSADATYQNDPFSTILPHYTRSLDAAWEGAKKIAADQCGTFAIFAASGGRVSVVFKTQTHGGKFEGAIHPAEALVLACLRAEGCSEEEMK